MKLLSALACVLFLACVACGQAIYYSDPNGYTDKSEKWINKKAAKVERLEGPAVAESFRQNMRELHEFGSWLRQIYREVRDEFGQCIPYSTIDSRINPNDLGVVIYPAPFNESGRLVSGSVSYIGRIQVVFWNVRADGLLQHAVDLVRGEMRNYFQWHLRMDRGQAGPEMWGVPACP